MVVDASNALSELIEYYAQVRVGFRGSGSGSDSGQEFLLSPSPERIEYGAQDSTTNTDDVTVSNETFAVASELRRTVEDVGAALASTQVRRRPM